MDVDGVNSGVRAVGARAEAAESEDSPASDMETGECNVYHGLARNPVGRRRMRTGVDLSLIGTQLLKRRVIKG